MLLNDLIHKLNKELASNEISDYCPNGLQVEGRSQVTKIITGVTASLALIEQAIECQADAILVHHGYFWKGESAIISGMKKQRIQRLLAHDISLIAYHLPIDVHPTLGNNAQLGKLLSLTEIKALATISPLGIVMTGKLPSRITHAELSGKLEHVFRRTITSVGSKPDILRIAWCTGGGQSFIDQVATQTQDGETIDAFISGEISEQTTHSAREQNIDFFAAGHHATERYGVKAVGQWLADNYALDVEFVDIDNPA